MIYCISSLSLKVLFFLSCTHTGHMIHNDLCLGAYSFIHFQVFQDRCCNGHFAHCVVPKNIHTPTPLKFPIFFHTNLVIFFFLWPPFPGNFQFLHGGVWLFFHTCHTLCPSDLNVRIQTYSISVSVTTWQYSELSQWQPVTRSFVVSPQLLSYLVWPNFKIDLCNQIKSLSFLCIILLSQEV